MAITRLSYTYNSAFHNPTYWNHTCSVVSGIVLIAMGGNGQNKCGSYGGVSAVRVSGVQTASSYQDAVDLYYHNSAPTGVVQIAVASSTGTDMCGFAVDYEGVDQTSPVAMHSGGLGSAVSFGVSFPGTYLFHTGGRYDLASRVTCDNSFVVHIASNGALAAANTTQGDIWGAVFSATQIPSVVRFSFISNALYNCGVYGALLNEAAIGVVIDDPTSPSVADDTAIQLAHDIPTVEDTVSLSALGEPTPYEGTDAYADDGLSASSTDEITLSVAATLEVAEATSVSLADAPAVDGAINMAVDDSASVSTSDDPGSIAQSLLLNDATSGSSADEAAVSRVDLYSINATLPQLETTEDLLYDQYGNPFYQTSFVGNRVMRGTLPTFTATVLSGFAGIIGQIPSTVKLPALRASTISGSSTYSNTVSAELPAFSVSSLWANRGDMSSIAKTLGGLYGAITAKVGIVGSIADTLPDLRVG